MLIVTHDETTLVDNAEIRETHEVKDTIELTEFIVCHDCGARNRVGVKFCKECGNPMVRPSLVPEN